MADIESTALAKAVELAEKYIAEARSIAKMNVLCCIRFLQAAQAALRGLEDEVDQILNEANIVCLFQWERRPDLVRRIGEYLNRYPLANALDEAIQGIKECHAFAQKDAESFFQRRRQMKADAMKEILVLLGELEQYLSNLGVSMKSGRENYAGPSGIDMPVLLELEKLLTDAGDKSNEVKNTVAQASERRQRAGLQHAAAAAGVIQKLMNSFGVSVPVNK